MTSWLPILKPRTGGRAAAIADALAGDIAAGRLKPGDRLPTHRELSWTLGVSVGTVTRAYAESERRGDIVGEVGRGTFVRNRGADNPPTVVEAESGDGFIDLSHNFPSSDSSDRAVAQAIADLSEHGDMVRLMAYQTSLGLAPHRAAGAAWLEEGGMPADRETVAVTCGAQHGILVAAAALTRPGDAVLAEELTFYGIKSAATLLGLRLHGVAIDQHGLQPEALDAACRATGARVLYCMSNLHNPTTAVMPEARRREVAEVCKRHGVAIIEDDVYGFLLEPAPIPLAALIGERSLYVTSLSKCVAPGLRIGFVRASKDIIERIGNAIRATSMMAAPLMAEVAANLIRNGAARDMARWQRAEAQARQAMVRRLLSGQDLASQPVSFHSWLKLPEPWRREEFVAEARRRSVGVAAADVFAVGRHPVPHAVRLCLAGPATRAQVEKALAILADILTDAPDRGMPIL